MYDIIRRQKQYAEFVITMTMKMAAITMIFAATLAGVCAADTPEASTPTPTPTHTLTVSANPPGGGTVSRDPDYAHYYAGTNVVLKGIPTPGHSSMAGYTFVNWTINGAGGTVISADTAIMITVDRDLTLTANFTQLAYHKELAPGMVRPDPNPEIGKMPGGRGKDDKKPPPKFKLAMQITTAVLAAGGIAGGIVYNEMAKTEYEDGKPAKDANEVRKIEKEVERLTSTRNALYALGGVGLGLFALTFLF